MCGLCGILGGEDHWSDLLPEADEAELLRMRRDDRRRRVQFLNEILAAYACKVSDWQGSKYQLSTYTGKTELIDNLQQLWLAVERISGHQPDPLASTVLARLEHAE